MESSESYFKIIMVNIFKKIKDEIENFRRELTSEKKRILEMNKNNN